MNERELDLTLGAIVLSRTQVVAPPILREQVRAVPLRTPEQRSWLRRIDSGGLQSMFSATKFVVAGVIVAVFGGFLLAGVLTTQSDDLDPLVGASPSTETTSTPAVMLPAEIPDSVDTGTLDTPLGPARWVHLRGDPSTLPTGLWDLVAGPSGGYILLDWEDDHQKLWRSRDLITWASDAMPFEAAYGTLTLTDGSYWLTTHGPGPMTLARSRDIVDWTDVDLDGLTPPGPDGYLWVQELEPPLVHDGTIIVPMSYRPDISGISLGLQISGDPGVRLTEIEPSVYEAKSYHRGEGGTVRFEDTGSGLHVIDHASGDRLAVLDGVSMEYIERWASGDQIQTVHRLAILDGDTLVDVPLPDTIEEARSASFEGNDSGFIAYGVGPDRRLYIHRSRDGRDWILSDVVGDDPGEPSDIDFAHTEEDRLVVGSESESSTPISSVFSSADKITWEPWSEEEEGGDIPIASGWISLPGRDDPAANDGSLQDTMWYRPRGGTRIPIDASDLDVKSLMVNGGGGAGQLSPNTIFSSQYQDEGARLREIWILTFDDIPT